MGDMRLLPAALLAALSLTGCANAGTSSPIAVGAAASAPFYLAGWQGTGSLAVSVMNGFTGQAEAAIAAPKTRGRSRGWGATGSGTRAVRRPMTGRSCCATPISTTRCGLGMTGNRSR